MTAKTTSAQHGARHALATAAKCARLVMETAAQSGPLTEQNVEAVAMLFGMTSGILRTLSQTDDTRALFDEGQKLAEALSRAVEEDEAGP